MHQEFAKTGQTNNEQQDQDRNLFLAMLAHELRTPASAILGWSTLLRSRGTGDETFSQGIKAIERSATLLLQLTEQLLDFSRVSNGYLWLHVRKMSLVPVLEAAIETVLLQAKAKEIDLNVSFSPSTGAVTGDPIRLQQVFTNILVNAIKFTPFGGRVDICLERQNGDAKVTVTDTGEGIRPEFLPYIFDPFRQVCPQNSNAHDGLGLGLTISRRIVEGHEGKIHAESSGEGKGARFTIVLPLED
jgi:two-component system, chemotaxis family, CheB/CheR fusion protein